MVAIIQCKCGACKIALKTSKPLFRGECCCHDCNAAMWYANHVKGGPKPQSAALEAYFFPNDFEIASGKESLGLFNNYMGGDTNRFYCKDCWTIILHDHPAYGTKFVMTQASNLHEKGVTGVDDEPLMFRANLKDLSEEEIKQLHPYGGKAEEIYQGVADNLVAVLPGMHAEGGTGEMMNLQILATQVGEGFVPTDEQTRMAEGPPSFIKQMQQAAAEAEAEA